MIKEQNMDGFVPEMTLGDISEVYRIRFNMMKSLLICGVNPNSSCDDI